MGDCDLIDNTSNRQTALLQI